eukprot:jgi/Botrbrau1/14970/Bobra.0018s0072.1
MVRKLKLKRLKVLISFVVWEPYQELQVLNKTFLGRMFFRFRACLQHATTRLSVRTSMRIRRLFYAGSSSGSITYPIQSCNSSLQLRHLGRAILFLGSVNLFRKDLFFVAALCTWEGGCGLGGLGVCFGSGKGGGEGVPVGFWAQSSHAFGSLQMVCVLSKVSAVQHKVHCTLLPMWLNCCLTIRQI